MRNKGKERRKPEGRRENEPLSRIDIITSVSGIIIASLVMVAAFDTLSNGSASLGGALLVGGIAVGLAPILNALWSRNR